MVTVVPTQSFQSSTPFLSQAVREYLTNSLAENTRRAYAADLEHFQAWGGTIPTSDVTIAEYLAAHGHRLSMATLDRRVAAISRAHTAQGFSSPAYSPLVRAVRRGIKRGRGGPQKRAQPITMHDLAVVLRDLGSGPKAVRDRAIVLLGFAGAFRRSELVSIDRTDLEFVPKGVVVTLRQCKTDPVHKGRRLGIGSRTDSLCPVAAITDWLSVSTSSGGPLFTRVDRHGRILPQRLSGEAVSLILKGRVAAKGYDPDKFSGHSLRAGFATSAAQAGEAGWKIRRQTGHATDAGLATYIREAQLFGDSAACAPI